MTPLPVAIQLYSLRDDLEKDFFGGLEKVKAMGYAGVEFAGYYGKTAREVRAKCESLGLALVSAHVALEAFDEDQAGQLAYHKELGIKYLVIPYLQENLRPGTPAWPATVKRIRALGEACHKAGFQLLYHNHDFEFVKIGKDWGLDLLYKDVPMPYLATEIDVCWVRVAGVDPIAYLTSYKGRAPLFHLKDFVAGDKTTGKPLYALIDKTGKDDTKEVVDKDSFDFRPLGEGVQDVPGLLKAAHEAGVEWIVAEQDRSSDRPPLEAMAASRRYLTKLGY